MSVAARCVSTPSRTKYGKPRTVSMAGDAAVVPGPIPMVLYSINTWSHGRGGEASHANPMGAPLLGPLPSVLPRLRDSLYRDGAGRPRRRTRRIRRGSLTRTPRRPDTAEPRAAAGAHRCTRQRRHRPPPHPARRSRVRQTAAAPWPRTGPAAARRPRGQRRQGGRRGWPGAAAAACRCRGPPAAGRHPPNSVPPWRGSPPPRG